MTRDQLIHTRASLGLTQAELGAHVGYSRYAVIGWETGRHAIPASVEQWCLEAAPGAMDGQSMLPATLTPKGQPVPVPGLPHEHAGPDVWLTLDGTLTDRATVMRQPHGTHAWLNDHLVTRDDRYYGRPTILMAVYIDRDPASGRAYVSRGNNPHDEKCREAMAACETINKWLETRKP